jgi:hypothetical protein
MSVQQQAELTDTNCPVNLVVNRNGGVTGLTAVVAVRDGSTADYYLDFFDDTFRQTPWTQKTAALADLGNGVYSLAGGLDISAMNSLVGNHLVLEFKISGAETGDAIDIILLRNHVYDVAVAGDEMDLQANALDANAVATSGAQEIRDEILDDATRFSGADIPLILEDTGTTIPALIAALENISVADILAAVLSGSGESVDTALSRLDNVDTSVTTTIPALIAALENISVSDILTAVLSGSGESVDTALSRLDNIDTSVTTTIPALIAALENLACRE